MRTPAPSRPIAAAIGVLAVAAAWPGAAALAAKPRPVRRTLSVFTDSAKGVSFDLNADGRHVQNFSLSCGTSGAILLGSRRLAIQAGAKFSYSGSAFRIKRGRAAGTVTVSVNGSFPSSRLATGTITPSGALAAGCKATTFRAKPTR